MNITLCVIRFNKTQYQLLSAALKRKMYFSHLEDEAVRATRAVKHDCAFKMNSVQIFIKIYRSGCSGKTFRLYGLLVALVCTVVIVGAIIHGYIQMKHFIERVRHYCGFNFGTLVSCLRVHFVFAVAYVLIFKITLYDSKCETHVIT